MRVFNVTPLDDARRLDMDADLQLSAVRPLGRGQPAPAHWQQPPVWRLKKPRKRREEYLADLTCVGANVSVPVMSARARALIEPLLGEAGQWLPLAFDECEYFLRNLLNVIDAVDVTRASIRRFTHGRSPEIEAHAFKPDVIQLQWLFKTVTATFDVLATERFRCLVEKAGLTGFHFHPVWDSAHEPFRMMPGREYIRTRPEVFGPEGFVANFSEFWPPEWGEGARQRKREAHPAPKPASS